MIYTNNSLEPNPKEHPLNRAVFLDFQGNILWSKELLSEENNQKFIRIAPFNDEKEFVLIVEDLFQPGIKIFKLSLDGETEQIGQLKSEISYHKLIPIEVYMTNENDLIIWQSVKLDSIINGDNLFDTNSRKYLIKIDAESLDFVSSSKDLVTSNNSLEVFPNPTGGTLNIKLKTSSTKTIKNLRLINSIGQIALEEEVYFDNSEILLDVNSINNGLYYLEVREKNELIGTYKIVIHR